jgi:hypothetical protein
VPETPAVEKTWPDTVHVRGHTAPLTGAFWWIVADNEHGLQVTGTDYFMDKEDAELEAERINNIRPIEMLREAVIETLPEKLELIYVHYDDQLTDEQVSMLLKGDEEGVWDSLSEWESDAQWYSITECWTEALKEFEPDEREALEEDGLAMERFQETCWERDDSDWFNQLLRNTPNVQVRYYLNYSLEPDTWSWDGEQIDEAAKEIAEVAGIEYYDNKKALIDLIINAGYGGELCVLHNSDIRDVQKVLSGGTVTFTDPYLLIYDGMNGSGMDSQVTGTVTFKMDDDHPLRHDAGSYSWSDDIAGVNHGSYDTQADFEEADNKEDS